jgi:hypothetical protein
VRSTILRSVEIIEYHRRIHNRKNIWIDTWFNNERSRNGIRFKERAEKVIPVKSNA